MPRTADQVNDATFALVLADGIGPATLRKLRAHFTDDDQIVSASAAQLAHINGIGNKSAAALQRAMDTAPVAHQREMMLACDAQIVLLGDADYPHLLATIPQPPTALWLRGTLGRPEDPAVAIVGSRRCSTYGREQAGRFSSLLAQSGLTIVSGGALGIDAAAHRGALRVSGSTVAVLGCGVDVAYPPQNEALLDEIIASGGAIISEMPMGAPPKAEHFPRRNRIISGLSLGVLVVEAALRSGALITARLAAEEQHREVMAIPGRVDSPASAGCLRALREGWAGLVVDHADVLAQLDSAAVNLLRGARAASVEAASSAGSGDGELAVSTSEGSLFHHGVSDAQQRIIDVLAAESDEIAIDVLAARCGLPLHQLLGDLTILEIRSVVRKTLEGISLRQR